METSQAASDLNNVFDEKYKLYGEMLFKLAVLYLGNNADSEEALQDAFIKLLYKAPEFANSDHEKNWLIRITINICKDKLKSFWRKHVVPIDGLKLYCNTENDLQLSELILKLPPSCKAVIHLHYYEKYEIKEISQILQISESAVKMRLKRGRDLLKIEMEGNSYE